MSWTVMIHEVFRVKGDPGDVQKMDLVNLVDEERQTFLEMTHKGTTNARA